MKMASSPFMHRLERPYEHPFDEYGNLGWCQSQIQAEVTQTEQQVHNLSCNQPQTVGDFLAQLPVPCISQ